jgi:hypothetical protein
MRERMAPQLGVPSSIGEKSRLHSLTPLPRPPHSGPNNPWNTGLAERMHSASTGECVLESTTN